MRTVSLLPPCLSGLFPPHPVPCELLLRLLDSHLCLPEAGRLLLYPGFLLKCCQMHQELTIRYSVRYRARTSEIFLSQNDDEWGTSRSLSILFFCICLFLCWREVVSEIPTPWRPDLRGATVASSFFSSSSYSVLSEPPDPSEKKFDEGGEDAPEEMSGCSFQE